MHIGASAPIQAVIICTRNRAEDLRRTLGSIAALKDRPEMLVLVVDGSDESQLRASRRASVQFETLDVAHLPFKGSPAGTRQRNYGLDHLPPSVEIVHFIDDDVVVLPGYFRRLTATLARHPTVGGVGGVILDRDASETGVAAYLLKRFFLLSSSSPGRVLPSGHVGSLTPNAERIPVEWLSTCSSTYRRAVFEQYRFDPRVEGPSPRLEDLDFSYRVRRSWTLLAEPRARLIHYTSAVNRRSVEAFAAESLPRRYWFVEKNIRHPLRKPAFWWATFGQVLATLTSSHPRKKEALRGLLRGVRDVWRRAHPLLRRSART